MERNFCTQAIVVKTRKVGDNNKNLTLLSVDDGLIEVRSFNSRSSRKAPKAFQFQEAQFFLYNNPVKNEYSLKDLKLISDHQDLRNDYYSIIDASIMCEFILKTGCDDMCFAYKLLTTSFDFLEDKDVDNELVVIQFILRIIKEHGLFENFTNCPICNKRYEEKEILGFTSALNCPCCSSCENLTNMVLPPGARKYLNLTLDLNFEDAINIKLNEITRKRIKGYMIRWACHIIGRPLKSVSLLDM